MLQFFSASTSIVNSRRAITECLEVALEGEPNLDCDLIILYTGMGHNFKDLLNEAAKLAPGAQVVGCTCAGIIGKEGPDESLRALAMMAIKGPKDEFAVAAVESMEGKNLDEIRDTYTFAAKELKKKLPDTEFIFCHPSMMKSPNFAIAGIESVFGKDVPILGGAACDNLKFVSDFQFLGETIIQRGGVMIGFADPSLEVISQGNHGTRIIGDPYVITDSGDYLVRSMNELPPWKTWNEKLGLTGQSLEAIVLSPWAAELSPELHEEYGSEHILVAAMPIQDDTIFVNRDLPKGSKLWLTRRTEQQVNEGVDWMMIKILERLDGRRPVAVFHADCVARGKYFVNRIIKDELVHRLQFPLTRGEDLPWLGMYGGAELTPMSGRNEIQIFTSSLYALVRKRPETSKQDISVDEETVKSSPLFESTTIKHLTLKNRFICSATWMGMANNDGSCSPLLVASASRISRKDIALYIAEMAYITKNGQSGVNQLGVDRDEMISGLSLLAKEVHRWETPALMQLNHGGLFALPVFSGEEVIGPSVLIKEGSTIGREMTSEEIHDIIQAFREASIRARKAGFDGIQVHAAHGWLLSQFLSPVFNRRSDEYGGSLENRARIVVETVHEIREANGPDFLVLVKINSDDFMEGGFTAEEMVVVSKMLENQGVDAIELSGGTAGAYYEGDIDRTFSPVSKGNVYYREASHMLKNALDIPVILVGGIRSFHEAETLVKEGITDYISLCRPLIREPDLISRWKSADIRDSECVSDDACLQRGLEGKDVQCVHLSN
jgi:2,4-dienoyl-CoA reductase-like NADH-dependent reductase (Old Yellow Enzyme family)